MIKADPETLLNTRDEVLSKCRHMNKSSNVNEVIRAVLSFFFKKKILHALKALKST